MSAAKNILKIAGAALATFLVVSGGAYFFLPKVAPDLAADSEADSSAVPDSATAVAQVAPPDTSASSGEESDPASSASGASEAPKASGPTSEPMAQASEATEEPPSSEAPPEAASKDTMSEPPETKSGVAANAAMVKALRDSIRALKRRLQKMRKETTAIQEEAKTLRGQLADAKAQRVKASELSSALLDMRRRKLSALLKKVNMNVLKMLYQRASGRSRTRLLQSMSPKRAAQFVNQVVEETASGQSSDASVASQ